MTRYVSLQIGKKCVVQLEIAHMHQCKKKTHFTDEGQSTAGDKNSNDLLSLVTTQNTSSDLKKCSIDVNQSILGADAHHVAEACQKIDVMGINNHEMTGLQMVDGTAYVKTQLGPVLLIMWQ
jgi:hypothetical protein